MTDNEVIQKLTDLGYTHAPKSLHGKVAMLTEELPQKHSGFYFPLFAFQMAIVGIVLLVLAGLGSGVVLAAKGSHPGTPLYPVRQILQKVLPQVIEDAPTNTPTPSGPKPTHSITNEENTDEGKDGSQGAKLHFNVQGGGEDGGEEREHEGSILPTGTQERASQEVEGAHTKVDKQTKNSIKVSLPSTDD